MTSAAEQANLEAELVNDYGLTLAQVVDLEALSPQDRAMMVAGWRGLGKLSWTAQPTAMDRFEQIVNLLLAIAGPVTTISGAVTGVGGAVAAIKNF